MLSKFSSTPTTEHLSAATYTLRYLRNTANLAIQNNASDPEATMPIGYTDSDFAGDPDDRKSTSGYVFMLAGGAITLRARKQPLVAFSTVEAEYCQNNGRPEMTDRRRRPEMTDQRQHVRR